MMRNVCTGKFDCIKDVPRNSFGGNRYYMFERDVDAPLEAEYLIDAMYFQNDIVTLYSDCSRQFSSHE